MKSFQKKSRHSILSLSLIGILLVAGCAGLGPEALAKALPDVQKFLSDHPNADITVALLGPDNMKDIAPLLKDSCPQVSAENSYYKVLVKDSDTNSVITIWIDAKSSQTICATRTGGTAFVPSKVKAVEEVSTTSTAAVGQAPLPPGGGSAKVPMADILITYSNLDLNNDGVKENVVKMEDVNKNKIFNVRQNIFTDTVYLFPKGAPARPEIYAYYYDGKNYISAGDSTLDIHAFCIATEKEPLACNMFFNEAQGFAGKNVADGTFILQLIGSGYHDTRLGIEFIPSKPLFTSVFVRETVSAGKEDVNPKIDTYSLKPATYKCVQLVNGAKIIADENGKYVQIIDYPLDSSAIVSSNTISTDCTAVKILSVPTTAQQGNETTVPTVTSEPSNQTTATTTAPSTPSEKNETATQTPQVEYKTYLFELAGGIDFTGDGIPDDAVRVYDPSGKSTIALDTVGDAKAAGVVGFKTSEIYLLPEKVSLPYSGPKIWPAKVFVKGSTGTADASKILLASLQFGKGFTLTQTSNYNPTIGHFVAYTVSENYQQQEGGYSGLGAELTIEYIPRTDKRAPSFSDGNGDNTIVSYYYQYENIKKEWIWATKDIYKTGDDDKCFKTQRGSGVSAPKSLKQIKVSIADYVPGESYGDPHFC